jgi:hypothetical protein
VKVQVSLLVFGLREALRTVYKDGILLELRARLTGFAQVMVLCRTLPVPLKETVI